MSIAMQIICDDCSENGRDCIEGGRQKPAHYIRHELRKYGWAVGLTGGKDYCPDCVDLVRGGEPGREDDEAREHAERADHE